MRLAITIMVITLVVAVALPCFAGNNPTAYVAVHVKIHAAKQSCESLPAVSDCNDITTTYGGSSIDAFPVFYSLTEYKGFEYGMMWPEWSYGGAFTNCADLVIGDIVDPGDGISHSWLVCQEAGVGIPGWLWLYADGAGDVCVVNHPVGSVGPGIYILDCAEGLDNPLYSFCAGVYGATGEDPCDIATEASTWSEIKNIFR